MGKDLLKPQNVPDAVVKYIVENLKLSSSWVNSLKCIMKPGQETGMMDFRIYIENDVRAKNIKVKDFASFDAYQNMVLFEGVYDSKNQTVQTLKRN